MPAAAVKTAPQTPKGQKAPQSAKKETQGQRKAPLAGLGGLSQAAGVAIMAALLVLSLFVGNLRALQNVSPQPLTASKAVVSIVQDRAAQARNAVNVAQRAMDNPSARAQEAIREIDEVLADYTLLTDARDLSRSDQRLTSAVAELSSAAEGSLSGEDATMLRRALDNFAEQGSFLRQEARAYNEKAEKALALYRALPTRFLLGEPSVYEGI